MSLTYIFFFIFLCIAPKFALSVNCDMSHPTKLGQLRKHLICQYDPSELPNKDTSSPVDITLFLDIQSYEFEEFESRPILKLFCWMPIHWIDNHLKWAPAQWNGIESVYFSSKEIWMPDVTLHNSDDGKSILSHSEVMCEVHAIGMVLCVLPLTLEVLCQSDFKKWPYETQNCWLYFGSWMSTKQHINYAMDTFKIYTNDTQKNLKWEITKTNGRVAIKKFKEKEYPTLSVNIRLKRLPSHYEIYLYPSVTFLTITNLVVFLINPKKHQKPRFSIIFLAMLTNYMIFSYLHWYLPLKYDEVPDIVNFFIVSLMMTMIALLETVLLCGILNKKFIIPETLGNFVQQMHTNPKSNIAFVEFIPDAGLNEQSATGQKAPVEVLLVTLLDRCMFVTFFIAIVTYFVVFALDWM